MDAPQTILLRDGRTLAFCDSGEARGFPVLSCHGTPACRLPGPWAAAAGAAGVRFIQPDRPGYGRSDYHPGLTLLEWALDAAELADSLGLDRFAVVGTSGGGPYAAACAHFLPKRVSALGLVCGVGPFWDVPEVDACASESSGGWIRELIDLGRSDPQAAAAHAREECEQDAAMVAGDPEEWIRFWFENEVMPEADRELAARPDVRAWSIASLRESLRGGIEGYVQDELILTVRPWAFGPEQIAVPVFLWHGDLDTLVPVGAAHYLARAMPRCRARFFPNEGHGIFGRHAQEILHTLLASGGA